MSKIGTSYINARENAKKTEEGNKMTIKTNKSNGQAIIYREAIVLLFSVHISLLTTKTERRFHYPHIDNLLYSVTT